MNCYAYDLGKLERGVGASMSFEGMSRQDHAGTANKPLALRLHCAKAYQSIATRIKTNETETEV
jgi:hypothetical protein